ncbi:hypothetical protein BN1182_AB_00120 [Pantoea ananatis]|nr:hypothetical protein BN1182_AB_00120 [Pantoea ananatis]
MAERRKTQARHLVRGRQAVISRHLKKCPKIVTDRLVELDKMGSIN